MFPESWIPPYVLLGWWSSPLELWVVLPMGFQSHSGIQLFLYIQDDLDWKALEMWGCETVAVFQYSCPQWLSWWFVSLALRSVSLPDFFLHHAILQSFQLYYLGFQNKLSNICFALDLPTLLHFPFLTSCPGYFKNKTQKKDAISKSLLSS